MQALTIGAAAIVVISAMLQVVIAAVLVWSVRMMSPYGTLKAKISELAAMVDNLEAQVINLRTKKANARSQQSRQTATAPPVDQDDDPLLAGLTPEEKALFM